MPNCEGCGNYIPSPGMCSSCFQSKVREAVKATKKTIGGFNKFKKSKTTYRDNLKKRLQSKWSKVMKDLYQREGYYYCWITGKTTNQKGLFSLHVSHYYPKSEIWQLWTDPVNSGLSSYNENVNKPHTVTQMRAKMIEFWGIDKVNDLDKRAEEYRLRIKMKIDPKHPTDLWMLAKLSELKSK